jgi:hypothetical protein
MDPAALQAWDGALVNCTSDDMCTETSGGSGGRAHWLAVSCSWMAGLPDGIADGRYCECAMFRVGATCNNVQPALQVFGAVTVLTAVLAGLAAWRGMRDLRQCPRELRSSPGAVCSAFNVCAASALMIGSSLVAVTRMTGGSAAFAAVVKASLAITLGFSFSLFLLLALVFETVVTLTAEHSAVNSKRWYCGATLLLAAEAAGISTAKSITHVRIWVAIGFLVVGLLWLRATVMLARLLDGYSANSAAIADKALATRQLIRFVAWSVGLMVACQAERAMFPLTRNSHPALIAATLFLDWVFGMTMAAVFVRLQDYLGAPLRKASHRQTRRILSGTSSGKVRPAGSSAGLPTCQPASLPGSRAL